MANLFAELRRRNVFRVAAAYVLVAWLLAQVADLALENFGAPDWVMKTFLLLLVLGLPVAVILAWALEMTPDGIRREKDVDRSESITSQTSHRLNLVIIGLLVAALGYFVYESRFSQQGSVETPVAAVPKTIAVLPFATFGGNENDGYLSDGLAETLLNLLAQIDELQVAARTSAFKFKGSNEDIRVIGEQLGVGTVLEGSVQRSGNRIRITAQLINVADGFHLYSETFERESDDLFAIQDEIASAVVSALEVELLGEANANPDVDAYENLMILRGKLGTSDAQDMMDIIQELETLLQSHSTYAEAHAVLCEAYTAYGLGGGEIPEESLAAAIEAGRRAVAVAPDNPAGFVALGAALLGRGLLTEAMPVVERALELQPGNANAMVMQGQLLTLDHRYREALEITTRAALRDPLNPNTRVSLAIRYSEVGQLDEGLAVLDLGLEMEPDDLYLLTARAELLYNGGRIGGGWTSLMKSLRLDPTNVGLSQTRFYFFFDAGDLEGALNALEQAEALSRDRLADERALYCYETGDTQCWHSATERMLETRSRFFVQLWQVRMLAGSGLIDEAIEALLPVVAYFDLTGDSYGNFDTRATLGALYYMTQNPSAGDAAFEPVTRGFEKAVTEGYGASEMYIDMAAVHAAQGDVEEAFRLLEEAYARGARKLDDLTFQLAFDRIRDDPRLDELVNRMKASNAQQLARATEG